MKQVDKKWKNVGKLWKKRGDGKSWKKSSQTLKNDGLQRKNY